VLFHGFGREEKVRLAVSEGSLLKKSLAGRRQTVFGASVLLAGFAIVNLLAIPLIFVLERSPHTFFHTSQQEIFFFDLFGFVSACWLLTWISALNNWSATAKFGQWLGIVFLCIDQVSLIVVSKLMLNEHSTNGGVWIAPALLQLYLWGSFFGFFTLPGLTRDGNRTLTGLGTLVLLLPWLIGRNQIVSGTEWLNGFFS
jgi:hypothetical protein